MLDSGNFVVHNSDDNTIWQSFEHSTDTFLASQHLLAFTLYSSVSEYDHSTGKFRLLMQGDGKLVLYAIGTLLLPEYSYWSSITQGNGANVTLCLDDDGHLYLLNSSGTYIKNLTRRISKER